MKMVTIFKKVNGKWLVKAITRIGFTEARIKAFENIKLAVRAVNDKIFVDGANNEYFVADR